MFNDEQKITKEEFNAMLEQLTPENKRKLRVKILQLLNAQEGREVEQKKYYYFFDCLDGVLSERYLTAQELGQMFTGAADPMPEKEIKRIARNYEAGLYRYEFDQDNNPINEVCLYDPFDM